jgi:2'-5' RNA ligase
MPTLAVIAYPQLEQDDRSWIEAIRAEHDPQASKLAAHFTLVFPAQVPEHELRAQAASVAAATPTIPFTIMCVTIIADPIRGDGHVFLVPRAGEEEVLELHKRLHAGSLAALLRPDRPFSPHITVGAKPNRAACMELAQGLAMQARVIRGTINRLEVIEVLPATVRTLAVFPLRTQNEDPGR